MPPLERALDSHCDNASALVCKKVVFGEKYSPIRLAQYSAVHFRDNVGRHIDDWLQLCAENSNEAHLFTQGKEQFSVFFQEGRMAVEAMFHDQ